MLPTISNEKGEKKYGGNGHKGRTLLNSDCCASTLPFLFPLSVHRPPFMAESRQQQERKNLSSAVHFYFDYWVNVVAEGFTLVKVSSLFSSFLCICVAESSARRKAWPVKPDDLLS